MLCLASDFVCFFRSAVPRLRQPRRAGRTGRDADSAARATDSLHNAETDTVLPRRQAQCSVLTGFQTCATPPAGFRIDFATHPNAGRGVRHALRLQCSHAAAPSKTGAHSAPGRPSLPMGASPAVATLPLPAPLPAAAVFPAASAIFCLHGLHHVFSLVVVVVLAVAPQLVPQRLP